MIRALLAFVYKNGTDCTNGGISSKYDKIFIVNDEGNFVFDEDDIPENLFKVVEMHFNFGDYKKLVQYNERPNSVMAGGNFAYTSDSRFPHGYPLPIHDRKETRKDYFSND